MTSHQDWNTIIIGNSNKLKSNTPKEIIAKKDDNSISDQLKKIDNDNAETFTILKIPQLLSKEITTARNAIKMTQKDVANKLCIQQNVYTDLENGKAVYDGKTKQLITKVEKIFGIKFQNKKL